MLAIARRAYDDPFDQCPQYIQSDGASAAKEAADADFAGWRCSGAPRHKSHRGLNSGGHKTAPNRWPEPVLRVFTAWEGGALLGGIFFTRLTYTGDPRTVFLMAPVAVAKAHQGKDIGLRLIAHRLDALRQEGVDIAVTYGDPAFYGRVGFEPVSGTDLPAPQPLNQPQGWIAQSLTGAPLTPLRGLARCVG